MTLAGCGDMACTSKKLCPPPSQPTCWAACPWTPCSDPLKRDAQAGQAQRSSRARAGASATNDARGRRVRRPSSLKTTSPSSDHVVQILMLNMDVHMPPAQGGDRACGATGNPDLAGRRRRASARLGAGAGLSGGRSERGTARATAPPPLSTLARAPTLFLSLETPLTVVQTPTPFFQASRPPPAPRASFLRSRPRTCPAPLTPASLAASPLYIPQPPSRHNKAHGLDPVAKDEYSRL